MYAGEILKVEPLAHIHLDEHPTPEAIAEAKEGPWRKPIWGCTVGFDLVAQQVLGHRHAWVWEDQITKALPEFTKGQVVCRYQWFKLRDTSYSKAIRFTNPLRKVKCETAGLNDVCIA